MLELWLAARIGKVWARVISTLVVPLLLALALWFAYMWAFNRGVASQAPVITQLKMQVVNAAAVNTANNDQIDALTSQINACTASVAANQQAAERAVANLASTKESLAVQSRQLQQAREAIYVENQQAAAWSRILVPPALVVQLRESTTLDSDHQDANR